MHNCTTISLIFTGESLESRVTLKCDWLAVTERIQYKLCLLRHKSHLRHPVEYISDLLTSVADVPARCALRASTLGNFVMLHTHRIIGNGAFSISASRVWIRLPTGLKQLQSTDSFRCQLKTFLFHSVCGHQRTDWWFCDVPSVFIRGGGTIYTVSQKTPPTFFAVTQAGVVGF